MPLPQPGTAWPPPALATVLHDMRIWDAWYTGDPARLHHVYSRHSSDGQHHRARPSYQTQGFLGTFRRFWWGQATTDLTQPHRKLHVPLAADICQASADLLFSEPPTIDVDHKDTTARLDDLVGDGLLSTLAEAAELGAALSGSYLRVTWDKASKPDAPFLTAIDADAAWPEFRFGRLQAVTFFWDVTPAEQRDGTKRLRHLERHELRDGIGVIQHVVYDGTRDNLGRPAPLTADIVGDGVLNALTDGTTVSTESPGLAVVYIPNQRPQRMWRHDPVGANLGRSDLDGVEGLMDGLDETYTSWMRDVRLGKARIMLPESMLDTAGPGRGAMFDLDREVYVGLNTLAGMGRDVASLPIQAQQFTIRCAEHAATADNLVHQILRTAGYSTQTFGEDDSTAGTTTATEIIARQQRSYMTRDRKVRLWRPAIVEIITKLLAVDASLFGSPVKVAPPTVQFADGVQDSVLVLAQTAQALRAADAASTEVLVAMVHPDWDDTQITEEVARIKGEQAATAVPDPFGTGVPHVPNAGPPADPNAGPAPKLNARQP